MRAVLNLAGSEPKITTEEFIQLGHFQLAYE